jgi:hypothetical protein
VRLEFKFRESAPPSARQRVVEKVKELGASKVEPLFPDEADPELASLYKAEGVPDDRSEQVVSQLGGLDEVDFAERTPERKLIR